MKTNLLKTTLLAASLLGALSSASAETLHARIPFGFSAAGTAMPAGSYLIRPMPNAPSVLLFENETIKMQAIVFVRTSTGSPAKPGAPLTFSTSASELKELTGIASDGRTYELSTHSPRRSPKGAALALTSGSK